MPVPAVMNGGMPTVSSGSQITTFGIIFGWKMIFLVCVVSSVMTPARPTSEPVPAVVGTATIGAMPSRVGARPPVADILEIPDRPRLSGHEGDELAGVEPAAAAEGDDAVMAAGLEDVRRPRVRLASTGFGLHVGEDARRQPALSHDVERRAR